MSEQRDANGQRRRPLLARGERLSELAQRTTGGGNKFHPFTHAEAWEALAPKGEAVLNGLDGMPADLRGRHVVLEATLLPNYLAGSHFPAEVLAQSGLYVVGSRVARGRLVTKSKVQEDAPTKTLLLAGPPSSLQTFARRLTRKPSSSTKKTWDGLRRLSDVTLPQPNRVIRRRPDLGTGEVITWEAVLTHVFADAFEEQAWADEHFAKWVTHVERLGGEVKSAFRRDLRHLTFVPIELAGDALDEAVKFNLLRAIRPMPQPRPFPNVLRGLPAAVLPSQAALDGRMPPVVVAAFDGGVDPRLQLFAPFVSVVDLSPEPANPTAVRHGSMVTSALLYGSVSPGVRLPDPPARVVHHRVLPMPNGLSEELGLYWILDQIVTTVRREHFPLVSLSIGPDEAVEDGHEPTRWTAELDALAADGTTFVVAVGNNGEDDAALGLNRVLAPGDMVNGLTVGACANKVGPRTARAPYSAVGPGREGQRISPTGVAFGGSDAEPFLAVDASGAPVATAGTSFAAPTVARGVADLWTALGGARRTPLHSRTFAVHFASRQRGHRFVELGHGRIPEMYGPVLECAPDDVTILYEDELPRTHPIAMRLPLPETGSPNTKLLLEWTISFSSEVDPRDACDYTLHGLEVTFRPHDRRRMLTNPQDKKDRHLVDLDRDAEEVKQALVEGYRLGEPVAHSGWRLRTEQELRAAGKWETVVRGRARILNEDLCKPRIDVLHLRRCGGQLVGGNGVPPLKIAMLVTLRAPKGSNLYDRVAASYPVLVPLVEVPVQITV